MPSPSLRNSARRIISRRWRVVVAACALGLSAGCTDMGDPFEPPPTGQPGADSVVLTPVKDNTLFENATGAVSNGAGGFVYVGQTGMGFVRRALVHFDLAGAMPDTLQILRVELTLHLSRKPLSSPDTDISVHRVRADWGEGASNAGNPGGQGVLATPGDATWLHTRYDAEFWSAQGGDFAPAASASRRITDLGFYTWSGPAMVADAQSWLDDPAVNFGWMLVGNESARFTARRFDSRESGETTYRPSLKVVYKKP